MVIRVLCNQKCVFNRLQSSNKQSIPILPILICSESVLYCKKNHIIYVLSAGYVKEFTNFISGNLIKSNDVFMFCVYQKFSKSCTGTTVLFILRLTVHKENENYLTFKKNICKICFAGDNLQGGIFSILVIVQDNLTVQGCPTNLDYSRARAYCSCSRCGWGWFGHFFSRLSFLFSFSLSLGGGTI